MKYPTLYEMAQIYFEFLKGRASELECLNAFFRGEEAGHSRHSLNKICNTIDILQGKIKNNIITKDGLYWR